MSARGGRGRARGRASRSAAQEPPPRQPGTQGAPPSSDSFGGREPRHGDPVEPSGAWGTGGSGSAGRGARSRGSPGHGGDSLTGQMAGMRLDESKRGRGGGSRGGGGRGRGRGQGERSVRARQRGHFDQYTITNFKTSRNTVQLSQTHAGVEGNKLLLTANFIPLVAAQNWVMYHYHCHFAPELERADWRRAVLMPHIEALKQQHRFVFDGMALYMMHDLGQELEWTSDHPNESMQNAGKVIIKLKRAATNAECRPDSPIGQHVTNVLFKKALRLMNLEPSGRSYYNMKLSYSIPEYHMEVYPGFTTAIAPFGKGQVMLQIDVSHRILRKDTAYEVMYSIYNASKTEEEYRRKSMKALLGTTVLTKYNQKTYRITDIDFKARVTDTFEGRDGTVSFIDYYKQAYNERIEDRQQPMLVSKPKEKDRRGGRTQLLYLVPELCYMTGLSDELATDFKVKQALQKVTRLDANGRIQRYNQFAADLAKNEESQKNFKQWNLHFANKPIEIQGRRLPRPELFMAGKSVLRYDHDKADWTAEMKDKKLILALDLTDWIVIHTQRDQAPTEEFLRELTNIAKSLGFRFQGRPTMIPLRDNRDNSYKQAIATNISSRTQMILCVIGGAKSQYDVIKKYCCRESPVLTQCIKTATLKKRGLRSIATKVMLQMQCKIGAELWAATPPAIQGMMKPFVIVGIDVYHDSERKGQSVVGIVSSLNKNMTRYFSQITYQTGKQEIGTTFKAPIFNALTKFHERNNRLPETVIVYRDGVGDGQLDMVLEQEITQFKAAFEKIGNPDIKLLYIIVQKRINTRLFLKMGGRHDNPPPGTVVDTDIVRPEWYDFFLVSQSVRQGTVSPTHYNILYDSVGWTPDQVQKLSYLLTHLYFNWQGTIRVPAPCQYAHKLAYLVGTSLHDHFDQKLADKLWYL